MVFNAILIESLIIIANEKSRVNDSSRVELMIQVELMMKKKLLSWNLLKNCYKIQSIIYDNYTILFVLKIYLNFFLYEI